MKLNKPYCACDHNGCCDAADCAKALAVAWKFIKEMQKGSYHVLADEVARLLKQLER